MVISLALKNSDVVNVETLGIACCILFTFAVALIKELAPKHYWYGWLISILAIKQYL